ncbi:unnamed protein product [Knipowitschia caucasica]
MDNGRNQLLSAKKYNVESLWTNPLLKCSGTVQHVLGVLFTISAVRDISAAVCTIPQYVNTMDFGRTLH